METLKVTKVAKEPYGPYIQLEDGTYRGTTENVMKFIGNSIPCEIEVTKSGEKGKVLMVKVLGRAEQQVLEEPKQEFKTANEFRPDNRQESIVSQFCIRESIHLIDVFNSISEEKLKPTLGQILTNAQMIR